MPVYQNKSKDSKVIYTSDGRSWYFRDYYFDIYGNKKQYKSPYYSSKKEAQEEERKWLNKIVKENNNENQYVFFLYVFDEWQLFRKMQLKDQTYYNFENRTNKYIKEYFKDYKLHFIKMNVINLWYKELESKAFSLEYKNTIINDLRDFLGYCRDNYDYDGKIVSKIQNYRIDTPNEKLTDAETNFWCYDEWLEFIVTVDNYEDWVMYNFLYYTGLRFGEFNALTWRDFDPINKTISITKNLTNKVKGKKYIITTPKTKNSVRLVDLDDELNNILIEYKEHVKKKSYMFSENDFMFGGINYIPHTSFARYLDKYILKVRDGFKRITPHGFRHSHVSLLIDLGCDSRDVAERIGDTVETVEKTYYHMFPKKKKLTINKLNDLKKSKK